MIRFGRVPIRTDREGQTLAVVAVSMVVLLALLSLGIDLGMAYTARAEAQRAADAAALAGASAFLDVVDPLDAVADAETRARDYASRNVVRNRLIDPIEDVEVQVLVDDQRVRVWVQRTGLPVWFARLIGRTEINVRAMAAAEAAEAGSSACIMPFAVPDLWHERTGDDLNNDRVFNFDNQLPYNGNPANNPNEFWRYEPAGHNPPGTTPDEYRIANDLRDMDGNLIMSGSGELQATGLGSQWRNQVGASAERDNGLRVLLKPQQSGHNQLNNWWQFWKPAGASNSYNDIRAMILAGECYDISDLTGVGGDIEPVPGDRAVVYSDIVDFIDAHDPDLRWNPQTNMPHFPNEPERSPWGSRRLVSVPLVHPDVLLRPSNDRTPLQIMNIATLFIEDPRLPPPDGYNGRPNVDNSVAITGRLVHRGTGTAGPSAGTIERFLRLVE